MLAPEEIYVIDFDDLKEEVFKRINFKFFIHDMNYREFLFGNVPNGCYLDLRVSDLRSDIAFFEKEGFFEEQRVLEATLEVLEQELILTDEDDYITVHIEY